MNSAWFSRTISAFPLSIGTSLAFESIFKGQLMPYDPEREIPIHIRIADYTVFYINLETLLRNMYGSVPKELFLKAEVSDVVTILESEVEIIQGLMVNEGRDTTKAVFYRHGFEDNPRLKNDQYIYLRTPKTELQIYTETLTQNVLKSYFKRNGDDRFIRGFQHDIKPQGLPNGLMLTHIPYDLTSASHFRKLDLIESHSGKLKNRSLWYTKFYPYGTNDMSYIPLSKRMLYIFGDHVSFSPWATKARAQIYELAKKYSWNYATTDDRVLLTLKTGLQDKFMVDTISHFPT